MKIFGKDSDTFDDEETLDEKRARVRHSGYSSYYNRYFEGYVENKVPKKNGGYRIERIYVGNTWKHDMTDSSWVLLKIFYCILFLTGVVLYIIPTSSSLPGNMIVPVQIVEALGGFLQLILCYNIFCYVTAKRDLTKFSYNETSPRIKRNALITSLVSFLMVLLQSFYSAACGEFFTDWALILSYMTSGMAFLAISMLERKYVKYEEIPFTGEIPKNEVLIE